MFFALNHPNYARWTVKYHNSLLTLEETRNFSGISGWLVSTEQRKFFQDVAASQRAGVASIANSISARQRWAESHFLRTTIIQSYHI